MSESSPQTYDVILLVEQALSELDARQVTDLHSGLPDPVRYHLILPVHDAAAAVEATMGSLGGDPIGGQPVLADPEGIAALEQEALDSCRGEVTVSVELLRAAGADVEGQAITEEPIAALRELAADVAAAEVIVLTRPHVVSEFFHLDWTSRARRALGVPVLHLLEHETFAEQAGGPEGISGA